MHSWVFFTIEYIKNLNIQYNFKIIFYQEKDVNGIIFTASGVNHFPLSLCGKFWKILA